VVRVVPAPAWVVEALSPAPPPPINGSRARHPSSQEFDPFIWLREHAIWLDVLGRHDWLIHSTSGGDVNYTRPGKAVRDGKSAVLHESGAFVVFSTEVPPVLEGLGHPTVDGTGFTVSIVEFICAYEFGGDMRLLGRSIRERFGPARPSLRTTSPEPEPAVSESSLSPDREFYDQRPWMAMCRQMAESAGGSPSAHLLAYLTRWATLIPPGYSIPAINGAPSSFDLLSVIAGTSGAGKTSPMRNAAELLPVDNAEIRLGLGIGSGEGIIEAFYGIDEIEGEDGKKRKERRKMFAGVNFAVSEGLIFAELAGRGGTTHVTRLCDAWSGSPLSTANASAETFRHIDVDQYRLTLMMGIQVGTAHELMTDSATAQGFVGRLLFAWAEEPRVKPRPRRPELVMLQPPSEIAFPKTKESPKRYQQRFLSYPDEVYAECQDASDARVGTNVPVEDHHHDLLRCKIAGIVALMDGRIDVSLADWAIATTLVEHSAATRRYLREHRRLAERDRRHRQAEARAEVEIVVDDVKERQAIARMAEAIRGRLDEPLGRNAVRKMVSSSTTKHRFEAALKLAISNGWVVEAGEQLKRG
jgi:hypothetical protein